MFDIIESEISHCEKSAADHNIKIQLHGSPAEPPVYVDALKISRVIRNLLYNAINHTADGDNITVQLINVEHGIRVNVSNPGEPISEEDQKIIWERYQRSQHQGARRKGTGIGLSIVSTILSAHGMPFGVECENGLTTFWFEYLFND